MKLLFANQYLLHYYFVQQSEVSLLCFHFWIDSKSVISMELSILTVTLWNINETWSEQNTFIIQEHLNFNPTHN